MDILLRRSAGVSTRRERPPRFPDVYRPTDLPGRVPPGGYRAGLRRLEEQRHSQRQQVSRRRRERVLHASCDTRCLGDDAGGHGPSTTVAGGRLEPKRSRRATGPQARHTPQGDPAGTTDRALSHSSQGSQHPKKLPLHSPPPPPTNPRGPSKMPRRKWARPAPGRTNASWRHSVFSTGRSTRFETCRDVSFGGVLCALPALAENGLFRHIHDCLAKLRGYYSTLHVIVLLAHMALCRIKTVEQLQYQPPGELGKLLGLDRVPEVRCLRQKLAALSIDDGPAKWAGLLSRDWLKAAPELAGALYVDGHVRLYHGDQTALPKRYVSRQRLCLRGTTDYWVNDVLGQPFFAVERPIDHGLLEVLKKRHRAASAQGCPRPADRGRTRGRPLSCTLRDPVRPRRVQPGVLQGDVADPPHRLHHLPQISQGRLADRPSSRRSKRRLPNGERVSLKLAERGTWIGDRKNGLWVREIRKLTESGHQVSLISTAFGESALEDSVRLFSRWSQENFLRYMMEHFAIDLLNEYRTEEIPETKRPVVNPKWRELDRQKRSVKSKLTHRQARFAALTLHPESDEDGAGQMGKTQSRIGGSDRAVRKGVDGHQRPVEDDAQPPEVGRVARQRKSSSVWLPAASNWSTR